MSRTVEEKEQQQTLPLLDFESLKACKKTKISPWRADRSGPE